MANWIILPESGGYNTLGGPTLAPCLVALCQQYPHEVISKRSITNARNMYCRIHGANRTMPMTDKSTCQDEEPAELLGRLTGLAGVFGSVAPSTLMLGRV